MTLCNPAGIPPLPAPARTGIAGRPPCCSEAPARRQAKASVARLVQRALFGMIAALVVTSAYAQTPVAMTGGGVGGTFSEQSVRPDVRLQSPTPMFAVGGLAVGIWTRVPPPYDATANRNLAANPLP